MLKNFNTNLLDYENNAISEAGKPVTMRSIIVNTINLASDNAQIDGEEKYKRYALAQRIANTTEEDAEINVSVEEVVLIKKCFNNTHLSPLVIGRVFDFLEA